MRWIDVCYENQAFAVATKNLFRTWAMALIAAGLREKRIASGRAHTWSEESIIREIQAIYNQPEGHRQVWETHMSMASAARRRFGSWANALQAAGITPVHKVRRRWDRQKSLRPFGRYAGEGLPLQRVYKTDPGLSAAARSFFGSWFNAVVAADVVSATHKPWRRWTRQCVLDAIRRSGRAWTVAVVD